MNWFLFFFKLLEDFFALYKAISAYYRCLAGMCMVVSVEES